MVWTSGSLTTVAVLAAGDDAVSSTRSALSVLSPERYTYVGAVAFNANPRSTLGTEGSGVYAAATVAAWKKSAGIGDCNFHLIAMGRSPVWLTYVTGPRNM